MPAGAKEERKDSAQYVSDLGRCFLLKQGMSIPFPGELGASSAAPGQGATVRWNCQALYFSRWCFPLSPSPVEEICLLSSRDKGNREPLISASACSSPMTNLQSVVGSVLGDSCNPSGGVGPLYFK